MTISFELAIYDDYYSFSFKLNHGNYNLSFDDEDERVAICLHDSCFLGYGNSQTFNQPLFGPFRIWRCFS